MRDLLLQVSVLMILNGLLAECSLLEKLQTRLREKFKGNFPYGVPQGYSCGGDELG